jgi:hypothetical protein
MQPSRSTVLSYTEMYGTCWREQTPFHAMQNKTEQKRRSLEKNGHRDEGSRRELLLCAERRYQVANHYRRRLLCTSASRYT